MARSLARPAMPVKSKSALSVVETKMTHFANGHHKPVHRNNISAHISGAPYCMPHRSQRPQSAHIDPIDTSMDDYGMDMLSRSVDDVTFSRLSALVPHMTMSATSDAALMSSIEGPVDDYFDLNKHFFRGGDARFDQPGGSNYASTRGSPTPQQAFPIPPANAATSPNFDTSDDMYPMPNYFTASSDDAALALVTTSLQQPSLAHSDGSAPPTGSPESMTDETWAAASAEFAASSRQASDLWDGGLARSAADVKSWMMLPTSTSSATYPGAGPQQFGGIFDSAAVANMLGVPALTQRQQFPESPLQFKHAARLMTPPAAVDSPPHGYVVRHAGGVASGGTSACASNFDEDEQWGSARVAGLDAPVAAPMAAGGDSSLRDTYSWLMDDDFLGRR
jgi:hypothetical protein